MTFRPPVRDLALALDALGHAELARNAFPSLEPDMVEAVLEGAGAFAQDVLAPLNRIGDTSGARHDGQSVTTSAGFADAYAQFVEQGWNGLSADPDFGGQGLSKTLGLAVFEMFHAANMAFTLCPMLTQGAIEALASHGTERQKRLVLPKLVSGEWTGTMNLTEAGAGSDLSRLTTRAEPDGAGGYRITGEKIYITWGDHDMTDNVCHLVLARTPDAPPGVRGISLFLATKRLVNDDGSLGVANGIRAGSIEHKLGIHGSPTCVMLFEGASAELVGDLGRGLAHMFVMMNSARVQVGVQGVGIAERAFQQALAFARERRQGRAVWSSETPAAIYDHPDVRRTLVMMKARIDAARGLCLLTALNSDLADVATGGEERVAAQARAELLTPIAKAWSTDVGVDVASDGIQIHGGMGFVEETGAAQHYRDARIAPIYEGTNGIQAIDLVSRKLTIDGGAAMASLCRDMAATADELATADDLALPARRLAAAITALTRATDWILANQGAATLAGATSYLKLCGDVIGGYVLARQALAASSQPASVQHYRASLMRVYASQILVMADALVDAITNGAADLESMSANDLAA